MSEDIDKSRHFFYQDFLEVLEVCVKFSIASFDTVVETWEQEIASDFFGLMCLHCYSINKVICPNNKIQAIPTAFVILRAVYETYLNMHYVCIEEKGIEERSFLSKSWERNELYTRLKMTRFLRNGRDSEDTQIREQETLLQNKIDTLTTELKDSSIVKETEKQLFGLEFWRFGNTADQAVNNVKINNNLHRFIYKLLSSYSHCTPYAVAQTRPSLADKHRDSETISILATMCLLLALKDLSTIFEPAKKLCESDEQLAEKIKYYENVKINGFPSE